MGWQHSLVAILLLVRVYLHAWVGLSEKYGSVRRRIGVMAQVFLLGSRSSVIRCPPP